MSGGSIDVEKARARLRRSAIDGADVILEVDAIVRAWRDAVRKDPHGGDQVYKGVDDLAQGLIRDASEAPHLQMIALERARDRCRDWRVRIIAELQKRRTTK